MSAQISGLENLTPELMALARLGIQDGMELLGAEGARLVQENITTPFGSKPAAVFTGNLAAGINFKVEEDQATTRLFIGAGASAQNYAAPVETGARPHMPPASVLLPWVMQKFGAKDEKQALSMAFAVARSIAKKGTQGQEMFSRALVEIEPLAVPTIEHAMAARFAAAGFGATA